MTLCGDHIYTRRLKENLVPMNTALVNVQQWGNSLAIRVPVTIARALKLRVGLPVELSVNDDAITIKVAGEPKLTLHQKLSAFEPSKHLPFGAYK